MWFLVCLATTTMAQAPLAVPDELPDAVQEQVRQSQVRQGDVATAVSERQSPEPVILQVDADANCVYMTDRQRPAQVAVRTRLAAGRDYVVRVSGEAWLSEDEGEQADPMPGVVVVYCSNEQDGFATKYELLQPGDTLRFSTPKTGRRKDLFLSAFFIDYWPESKNRGSYQIRIDEADAVTVSERSVPEAAEPEAAESSLVAGDREYGLNVTFADDPGEGRYGAVVGDASDCWNLVDVGTRQFTGVRLLNGRQDDLTLEVSDNDGEWGIAGQTGVYHGYIYHNCQCVDLSVTLRYLPAGTYDFYVYAHGDAPDQNAAIEIQSGAVTYTGRSTLNNGTHDYRNSELREGNQYVRYRVEVFQGEPVVITSRRDGSSYAMLNAVQVRRVL
jgi:hypothetical protein